MEPIVIGAYVVVHYDLGTKISDVRLTDGYTFDTEDQKIEAKEKVGRKLCWLLSHNEGYGDDTGKLFQDLMKFEEVTIHDEAKSALYRLKIQCIEEAWQ
jgi:uncharacterized membrane-anchored protein